MDTAPAYLYWLTAIAGLVMTLTFLRAIGRGSVSIAGELVERRREAEARRHEENLAAEAAGRAAALEPLALNSDGSIEEPILAIAETPES
jgi:hypothetical protein